MILYLISVCDDDDVSDVYYSTSTSTVLSLVYYDGGIRYTVSLQEGNTVTVYLPEQVLKCYMFVVRIFFRLSSVFG